MSTSNIFLVIISGLGVIHGFFLAIFLWIYPKGNSISNKILSLLLVVLSFRVGKSVFMEFAEDIDVKLIFVGLGTLMAIGPLFYLYILSYITEKFRFKKRYLVHFIPSIAGVCFGFYMDDEAFRTLPKMFFAFIFFSYYLHYLIYLLISYLKMHQGRKKGLNPNAYSLLRLLFFALLAIWIVYVLNLFDEFIPYVIGPILYTLVAYLVSFIVIQKGYIQSSDLIKYKTTHVSDEQMDDLFKKVMRLVVEEKQFKDEALTLKSLSSALKVSTQILSMVINKQGGTNFNSFINQHRISEAISMFQDAQYNNHTIASIAFEVGFNSITSFNAAFKKQIKQTPLVFRKHLIK